MIDSKEDHQTSDNNIGGWYPEELKKYDMEGVDSLASYSISNLKHFVALTCCLGGGEESASLKWPRNPELKELAPILQKVKEGKDIVDIAAGFGEPSAGMLLELSQRFRLKDTKYLVTDIDDYGEVADEVDLLGGVLLHDPKPLWVDKPDDYYFNWSLSNLNRNNWQDVRDRVLRRYGNKWDATKPSFYDNIEEVLGKDKVGLFILRHPEIGDARQPELTPIFTDIINNLLEEAVNKKIPVFITTSNNELSRKNIGTLIDSFFEKEGTNKDLWKIISMEDLEGVTSHSGPRALDSKIWATFPKTI